MSTRREREPIIPDRLPGEQELSRLYQQTPDERPPAALDVAILAEARRAARPRLRLLKGGKSLGQLSRRWAIPMSLAAALLITIGVANYLQDDIGRPLMRSQTPGARLSEAEAPYAQQAEQADNVGQDKKDEEAGQKERKKSRKRTLPEDAVQPKNEVMRPAPQTDSVQPAQSSQATQPMRSDPSVIAAPPSSSSEYRQENTPMPAAPAPVTTQAPLAGKTQAMAKRKPAKQKLKSELRQRRESQDDVFSEEKERDSRLLGMATEEANMPLMDALEDLRMDAPAEPEERSPQEWLEQISELFRLEKDKKAEESLEAFQKRYPDYTDFPDTFPEEVLARLRKR